MPKNAKQHTRQHSIYNAKRQQPSDLMEKNTEFTAVYKKYFPQELVHVSLQISLCNLSYEYVYMCTYFCYMLHWTSTTSIPTP